MLKYQVKSSMSLRASNNNTPTISSTVSSPSYSFSMTSLLDDTLLGVPTTSRSNSMLSLNSMDSGGSDSSEMGVLKVDTRNVKQCTDYKTIRVTNSTTTRQVIEKFLNTLKLTCRDPNLFDLFMELKTKAASGIPVVTLLKLDDDSRPYELQRCHPMGMSRFILCQNPAGFLVRVYDHNISPQSNYKSLLLSTRTTCHEAIQIVLALNRRNDDPAKYGLFLSAQEGDAQIPNDVALVAIARLCKDGQRIVIRNVAFL
ncbi:unnamed protein product [Caenorhabditis bovis]|uniref:Ras-associating domain-containing protein n=1 Tax=Caenorhabditis bovis TaxID=2654633 RepID=A0A8S1ED21_9PELO|nr:unnamed protein product [Caenorhabditis bovis]